MIYYYTCLNSGLADVTWIYDVTVGRYAAAKLRNFFRMAIF